MNKLVTIKDKVWAIPDSNEERQFHDVYHEIYKLKVYDYHKCSIEKDFVVIDIGANIGMFSVYCVEKEVKQVIAIEPGEIFSALTENVVNFKPIVKPINSGAWSHSCTLDFLNMPVWSVQGCIKGQMKNYSPDFSVKPIKCMSVDHIVNLMKLDKVDFIKIDSEGSEREIIEGAKYTIKTFKPRMAVSLYHNKDDWNVLPKMIFDIIWSYQFTPISYKETGADIGYFY